MFKRRGHIGQVSDSLPNMLISPFFFRSSLVHDRSKRFKHVTKFLDK